MGDYNAIATKLKVKKTAPKELISFLDQIYTNSGESESTSVAVPNTSMAVLINKLYSVCYGSAYHETWAWRVKEDCGEYWLYESRSSSKRNPKEAFKSLVEGIFDYLVIETGDIFFISIWENAVSEDLLYWDGSKVVEREGRTYEIGEEGYLTDHDHPYVEGLSEADKEAENDGTFNTFARHEYGSHLIWTVEELDSSIAKKKRREGRKEKLENARWRKYPSFG